VCTFGFRTKDGKYIGAHGHDQSTTDFDPDAVRQIKLGFEPDGNRLNQITLLNSAGEVLIQRGDKNIGEEMVIDVAQGERIIGVKQQIPDPTRYHHCV
jgi:hypothetical protein